MGSIHGKSHKAIKLFKHQFGALQVYWIYASRINNEGVAWPSLNGLATDTGMNKKTVHAARKWLVEHRALSVVKKYVPPDWRKLSEDKCKELLRSHSRTQYFRITGYILDDAGEKFDLLYFPGNEQSEIEYEKPNTNGLQSVHDTPSNVVYGIHGVPGTPELSTSKSHLDSIEESFALGSATQHLPDNQDSSPAVAETPKRTPRSESKQTIPAGQMNPMKDAIAAAFGWEWSTMTKTNIGMIQKVARELCEAGYAPADVAGIYQHCKNQKFDTFTPVALTKHAADWKTKVKQAEARRQPAARPVQAQTEQGEDFYTTRAFIQRTLLRTPVEKRRESPHIWRSGVSDAYLKANGLVWDDVNVMPVPATGGEAR
jgi:hypothetical protein